MDHVSEGWRPQTRTLTQMHNRRLHRRAFTHSCRFKLKASNPSRIIHPRTSTDVFHYPISIICIKFNSKTSAQLPVPIRPLHAQQGHQQKDNSIETNSCQMKFFYNYDEKFTLTGSLTLFPFPINCSVFSLFQ